MAYIPSPRRVNPFHRLTGPDKLRKLQHSFPMEATAIVALIDFVWDRKMNEVKRGN